MFKTYAHAELSLVDIFGDAATRNWQYVELEVNHPWLYVELVRDHGDDIVGSMLMIPTVPVLQQMLSELDERSWFAQAHLVCPSYLTGGKSWRMEPLLEISVAQDDSGTIEGYVFKVEGGACYSIQLPTAHGNLKTTEIIFSAERDLRA